MATTQTELLRHLWLSYQHSPLEERTHSKLLDRLSVQITGFPPLGSMLLQCMDWPGWSTARRSIGLCPIPWANQWGGEMRFECSNQNTAVYLLFYQPMLTHLNIGVGVAAKTRAPSCDHFTIVTPPPLCLTISVWVAKGMFHNFMLVSHGEHVTTLNS